MAKVFDPMGIRDLLSRLVAAERVCALYGWGPIHDETEIEKATMQAWQEWTQIAGDKASSPEGHPELDDAEIKRLAAIRDEVERRTMAQINRLFPQLESET